MSICAVGEALLDLLQVGVRDQARGLRDLHRKAAEALGEGLVVLARQQRGRHDDRDLLAADRGDEGGAQRDLGLAEADVAADQPVHRLAGAEIVEHGVDRAQLVLGLVIGEAGAEFLVEAVRQVSRGASRNWRSAAILISSPAISRMRFLTRALRVCQPTPPSLSSWTPASSEP